ncbi:MAG: cytochrome c biogenesis protein CcdA, partial [Candidatus Eremiobacteraeota bacterium]|nr:cytochrome c biogenesis protein CcdA [Candidatus Eremiobacteraeota bacterium]
IARIGGVITIILGLQMIGVFRFKFLARDTRPQVQREDRSYLTSAIVGLAFAAGWSPCIGPILAGILTLASQAQTVGQGTVLLLAYSVGLAVPFLITALAMGVVLPVLNRIKRYLPAIEIAAGTFMIATGVVLVMNWFLRVAGWFYSFVPQPKL